MDRLVDDKTNVIARAILNMEKITTALREADVAFAVININSEKLVPQARQSLKYGWAAVQEAIVALYLDTVYCEAIKESSSSAMNIVRKEDNK